MERLPDELLLRILTPLFSRGNNHRIFQPPGATPIFSAGPNTRAYRSINSAAYNRRFRNLAGEAYIAALELSGTMFYVQILGVRGAENGVRVEGPMAAESYFREFGRRINVDVLVRPEARSGHVISALEQLIVRCENLQTIDLGVIAGVYGEPPASTFEFRIEKMFERLRRGSKDVVVNLT